MLLLDKPARLMLYLLGAYLTGITLGLTIVFSASNSSTTNTTESTLSPAVDIALGAIALIAAWVVWSGRQERFTERRRARKAAKPDEDPRRWQRELSKGSPRTTLLVGMLLTLPGASYLAGLDEIHKLHYSTTVTVLLVIGFAWSCSGCSRSARQLPGRAGVDASRDPASEALGLPPLTHVRRQRAQPARRTADHQGYRRNDLTSPARQAGSCSAFRRAVASAGPARVAAELHRRLGHSSRVGRSLDQTARARFDLDESPG